MLSYSARTSGLRSVTGLPPCFVSHAASSTLSMSRTISSQTLFTQSHHPPFECAAAVGCAPPLHGGLMNRPPFHISQRPASAYSNIDQSDGRSPPTPGVRSLVGNVYVHGERHSLLYQSISST